MLPVEVSRALAALRCLPCLVGSFVTTSTEGARREAVGRPLGLIEELFAACSAPSGVAATNVVKKAHGGGGNTGGEGEGEGIGLQTDAAECNTHGEVIVLRAYALEAGVGLCCLLPADGQSGMAGREKTLERLLRWHER